MKIITILIITICFIFFILNILLNNSYNKKEEIIIINPGDTLKKIVTNLIEKKIVKNKTNILLITYILQKQYSFKPGKYIIQPNTNILKIIKIFSKRNALIHKITIPEGLTTYQILHILQETKELFGIINTNIGEGELYPSTYYFKHGDNINSLVNAMKYQMNKIVEKLWLQKSTLTPVIDKKEAIILASLIEKEAANNYEKNEISGVFTNRLNKKMKLQSDPTVIYAITNGKQNLNRTLTRKDLQIPSQHNTYYVKTLPPTPITNPGFESIKAALHPNKTDNLYFIANGNHHIFSKTLEEHNSIKRQLKLKKYQKNNTN